MSDTDLTPDTDATQQTLTDSVNANTVVTAYAHAMLNVQLNEIPGLDTQPDWFNTMKTNLAIAQTNANEWINTIGPNIFATVPQSIINYSNTFTAATNEVLTIIDAAGSSPSDDQKTQILELLNATLTRLDQQKTSVSAAYDSVVAFNTLIETDETNLVDGQDGANAAILTDGDAVLDIQSKIDKFTAKFATDKQLATTAEIGLGVGIFIAVAGFALAVATGGAAAPLVVGAIGVVVTGAAIAGTVVWNQDMSDDLKEINDAQNELDAENAQISALQTIVSAASTLVSENQGAQAALSTILDMYETLSQKMSSVITDLTNAEADEVASILQKLDIETAQTAWSQLTDFATQIESLTITVQENVDAPEDDSQVA